MKGKVLTFTILSSFVVANATEIKNPIVKKLYEKGIITEKEAIELDKKSDNKLSLKSKKIKFEGLGYIGYTYVNRKKGNDEGYFEVRRAYFISKFYFNKKDYARLTLDITTHNHKDNASNGKELMMKIKHFYLYKDLSSFIPYTGFEIGVVHTPWLDYEEHSGWWYRSISKTFYESSDGAHMLPSADTGIDFKTKTNYLSAEYGIFDGEGYDNYKRNNGSPNKQSIEGRITYHAFGNGKKHINQRESYLNISIHTVYDIKYQGQKDLRIYQVHAVYNQPLFLLAGQFIKSKWKGNNEKSGNGYSLNFEVRPVNNFALFGRYDNWNSEDNNKDRNEYLYGIAWSMNKHVKWIINGITTKYKNDKNKDYTKYMFTAEIHF